MRSPRLVLVSFLLAPVFACDADPTEASVVNELPGATIEKVWYRTTLFTQPLESGQSSEPLRVGTGEEHAYAVVRVGTHTYAARTAEPVRAEPGDSVRIVLSPTTVRSVCFGQPRITEEDQRFIASRVFPSDDLSSDPAGCD